MSDPRRAQVASSRVWRNRQRLKQSLCDEKDNYSLDYRCAFPFVRKQLGAP